MAARRTPARTGPQPLRPLGSVGQEAWERIWKAGASWLLPTRDVELVQLVCEQYDERASLRLVMFREARQGEPSLDERRALRAIDEQIASNLKALGLPAA